MPKRIVDMDWSGGAPPPMGMMIVGDGEKGDEPHRCLLCEQTFPGGHISLVIDGQRKAVIHLHLVCAKEMVKRLDRMVHAIEFPE